MILKLFNKNVFGKPECFVGYDIVRMALCDRPWIPVVDKADFVYIPVSEVKDKDVLRALADIYYEEPGINYHLKPRLFTYDEYLIEFADTITTPKVDARSEFKIEPYNTEITLEMIQNWSFLDFGNETDPVSAIHDLIHVVDHYKITDGCKLAEMARNYITTNTFEYCTCMQGGIYHHSVPTVRLIPQMMFVDVAPLILACEIFLCDCGFEEDGSISDPEMKALDEMLDYYFTDLGAYSDELTAKLDVLLDEDSPDNELDRFVITLKQNLGMILGSSMTDVPRFLVRYAIEYIGTFDDIAADVLYEQLGQIHAPWDYQVPTMFVSELDREFFAYKVAAEFHHAFDISEHTKESCPYGLEPHRSIRKNLTLTACNDKESLSEILDITHRCMMDSEGDLIRFFRDNTKIDAEACKIAVKILTKEVIADEVKEGMDKLKERVSKMVKDDGTMEVHVERLDQTGKAVKADSTDNETIARKMEEACNHSEKATEDEPPKVGVSRVDDELRTAIDATFSIQTMDEVISITIKRALIQKDPNKRYKPFDGKDAYGFLSTLAYAVREYRLHNGMYNAFQSTGHEIGEGFAKIYNDLGPDVARVVARMAISEFVVKHIGYSDFAYIFVEYIHPHIKTRGATYAFYEEVLDVYKNAYTLQEKGVLLTLLSVANEAFTISNDLIGWVRWELFNLFGISARSIPDDYERFLKHELNEAVLDQTFGGMKICNFEYIITKEQELAGNTQISKEDITRARDMFRDVIDIALMHLQSVCVAGFDEEIVTKLNTYEYDKERVKTFDFLRRNRVQKYFDAEVIVTAAWTLSELPKVFASSLDKIKDLSMEMLTINEDEAEKCLFNLLACNSSFEKMIEDLGIEKILGLMELARDANGKILNTPLNKFRIIAVKAIWLYNYNAVVDADLQSFFNEKGADYNALYTAMTLMDIWNE